MFPFKTVVLGTENMVLPSRNWKSEVLRAMPIEPPNQPLVIANCEPMAPCSLLYKNCIDPFSYNFIWMDKVPAGSEKSQAQFFHSNVNTRLGAVPVVR